jgi:hypothetical protein
MLVYPASVTSLLADADSGPPTEWKVCPSVVGVQLREVASSWPSVRLPPLWLELLRIFAVAAVHDPHLVVPALTRMGDFPSGPPPTERTVSVMTIRAFTGTLEHDIVSTSHWIKDILTTSCELGNNKF